MPADNTDQKSKVQDSRGNTRLLPILLAFLRLGLTAFGGPAAHIGMYHNEFVKRRKWLTNEHFLDLLGATNLIPGPNSTEMAIHIGYVHGGHVGLLLAGVGFIVPAMLIVIAISWTYAQYGNTPQASFLLYGIKPVIIAIILQALWNLGRKALSTWSTFIIGCLSFILYLLGVNEILLLLLSGVVVLAIGQIQKKGVLNFSALVISVPLLGLGILESASFNLGRMFLIFLKIGAVLYGSGYVLLAFLRADFVERLGWLTDQQLFDAIAIGQITPGPLLSTATFIGYQLNGVTGAILATIGVFLPSFLFVLLLNPVIPRVRNSPWAGKLLDGVNAGSLGLMAAVTLQLARSAFVDPWTIILGLAGILLLIKYNLNSTWLVLIGALGGLLSMLLSG